MACFAITRARRLRVLFLFVIAFVLQHGPVAAQSLTGALIGIVKDAQGRVLQGAVVRVTSQTLMGIHSQTTNENGQFRFPALPPGQYVLDVQAPGFTPYHEEHVRIGVGATLDRTTVLDVAGIRESVVVEGSGSEIEARNTGFETRFGLDNQARHVDTFDKTALVYLLGADRRTAQNERASTSIGGVRQPGYTVQKWQSLAGIRVWRQSRNGSACPTD